LVTECEPPPGEHAPNDGAAPVGMTLHCTAGGPLVTSVAANVHRCVEPGPKVWWSGPSTVRLGTVLSIVIPTDRLAWREVVSKSIWYGALLSVPTETPPTRNWTLVTSDSSSDAVAESVTVPRLGPAPGAVSSTSGALRSS
jgi:hypothetical protein